MKQITTMNTNNLPTRKLQKDENKKNECWNKILKIFVVCDNIEYSILRYKGISKLLSKLQL